MTPFALFKTLPTGVTDSEGLAKDEEYLVHGDHAKQGTYLAWSPEIVLTVQRFPLRH